MWTTVEVKWDIFVQCGRHIYLGAYASDVTCMDPSAPSHIIDCIEFI